MTATKTPKAEKATKTVKAHTAKAMARKRATEARKEHTANLRKIERVRLALEKAAAVIAKNGEDLKGDTGAQVADILSKINVAVIATTAATEAEVTALARTFVAR